MITDKNMCWFRSHFLPLDFLQSKGKVNVVEIGTWHEQAAQNYR